MFKPVGEFVEGCRLADVSADCVDGAEFGGGNQPCTGGLWNAFERPFGESGSKRFLDCVVREFEISDETNESRSNSGRIVAENLLDLGSNVGHLKIIWKFVLSWDANKGGRRRPCTVFGDKQYGGLELAERGVDVQRIVRQLEVMPCCAKLVSFLRVPHSDDLGNFPSRGEYHLVKVDR